MSYENENGTKWIEMGTYCVGGILALLCECALCLLLNTTECIRLFGHLFLCLQQPLVLLIASVQRWTLTKGHVRWRCGACGVCAGAFRVGLFGRWTLTLLVISIRATITFPVKISIKIRYFY